MLSIYYYNNCFGGVYWIHKEKVREHINSFLSLYTSDHLDQFDG